LLLDRFDQNYICLVNSLPVALQVLAQETSVFKGRLSGDIFRASTCTNPIYTCTPWLFWELFSGLADEVFLDLTFAGGLVSLASVLIDHLIDGQAAQPQATADLRQVLLREGVLRLHAYFPWKAPFWDHFRRLHREHLCSLAIETGLQATPTTLSRADFVRMASGKVSPVMITVVALSLAAGNIDWIEPVERSLKQLFIAGQLHDDVLDWLEDLRENHLTYFLTSFLARESGSPHRLLREEEILVRLDRSWQDVNHLEQAIAGYRQALAVVDGLGCLAWTAQVNEYLATAEMHRSELMRAHVIRRLSQIAI
jgi:hypothetical protein